MFNQPAVTPKEIAAKLAAAVESNVGDWGDSASILAAIASDLGRVAGVPVGPEMAAALLNWRAVQEEVVLSYSEEAASAQSDRHSAACRMVLRVPCTTPGDFLAKTYMELLGNIGCTYRSWASGSEFVGNVFDIDIARSDDPNLLDEAWQRAAYNDLDHCDLGANLLAYGLPSFSAEHWLQRADTVGLKVYLIKSDDRVKDGLMLEHYDADARVPQIVREKSRLRRLLAFDAGRGDQVAREIENAWPHLICPHAEIVGGAQ